MYLCICAFVNRWGETVYILPIEAKDYTKVNQATRCLKPIWSAQDRIGSQLNLSHLFQNLQCQRPSHRSFKGTTQRVERNDVQLQTSVKSDLTHLHRLLPCKCSGCAVAKCITSQSVQSVYLIFTAIIAITIKKTHDHGPFPYFAPFTRCEGCFGDLVFFQTTAWQGIDDVQSTSPKQRRLATKTSTCSDQAIPTHHITFKILCQGILKQCRGVLPVLPSVHGSIARNQIMFHRHPPHMR